MRGAVSEMPIVHIEPPTKEEIERYKRAKNEEFLKSFSDKEKMQRMNPKAVVLMRGVRYGLCPKCEHCLIEGDSYCDECFQRIDWSEQSYGTDNMDKGEIQK